MGTVKPYYGSFFIYLLVTTNAQPVLKTTFRVIRQAGYVYDRPSISFELPTQATTQASIVSTQAPTVDRTQAQMMYYAYPVPASGGAATIGATASSSATASSGVATAGISGVSSSSDATASNSGSSSASAKAGYNYGPQNVAPIEVQSPSSTGSSDTSSVQSPGSPSGYGYGAPTAGAGLSNNNNNYQSSIGPTQSINIETSQGISSAGASQSSNSGLSGYSYGVPTGSQQSSGLDSGVDVSTNAPKYLPPKVSDENANDVPYRSDTAGVASGGQVSTGIKVETSPLDQYLPPETQYSSPSSLPVSRPTVNADFLPSLGSNNYIPPNAGVPSSNSATPRPFAPSLPNTGYLPPNVNSAGVPSQSPPSTPASTYLPPII